PSLRPFPTRRSSDLTSASVVERLQQDVVLPARMRGYRHVRLVGISLGGYGSLLYSKQYGEQIAGLFLMAPFLGNRSLIAEDRKTDRKSTRLNSSHEK